MVQISLPVAILSLAAFTSTAVASPLPGTPLPAAVVAKIKAANAAKASASAAAAASVVKTSALVCGQNGYDKGVGSIQYGTFGDSSGSPYAKCLKRCKADKECVSFAYSGVDKACSLYSVTLAANFNENAASNWLFYDLGCSTTS